MIRSAELKLLRYFPWRNSKKSAETRKLEEEMLAENPKDFLSPIFLSSAA